MVSGGTPCQYTSRNSAHPISVSFFTPPRRPLRPTATHRKPPTGCLTGTAAPTVPTSSRRMAEVAKRRAEARKTGAAARSMMSKERVVGVLVLYTTRRERGRGQGRGRGGRGSGSRRGRARAHQRVPGLGGAGTNRTRARVADYDRVAWWRSIWVEAQLHRDCSVRWLPIACECWRARCRQLGGWCSDIPGLVLMHACYRRMSCGKQKVYDSWGSQIMRGSCVNYTLLPRGQRK